MPRLRALLTFGLFALVAFSGVACHRVRVEDVAGPDGQDWKSVSCRHMDKHCYKAAAEMCPNGYYFARAGGPLPASAGASDADEPSTSRDPHATAPSPRAGVNAKTLPPQERWGSGMYSKRGGTILVQCAHPTSTDG